MPLEQPDTISKHDQKVLRDAAKMLDTAAGRIRKIAAHIDTLTFEEQRRLMVEATANIDAAQARLR